MSSSIHKQYASCIPNLPEGVIIDKVGMGKCAPDEFEFYGDRIVKGGRPGMQVVVKPADGYEFVARVETADYIAKKL